MTNDYGFIGADPGSTGAVTVDGAGSTWTTTGEFYLGQSGNGTLTVSNGGTLISDVGYIGFDATSTEHRDQSMAQARPGPTARICMSAIPATAP